MQSMSQTDENIGAALTRLRGEKSQQWVADRMRNRGWKWTQTTVWNVERGERPLRLAEAKDLGEILETDVHFFLLDGPGQDFEVASMAMFQAAEALRESISTYQKRQVGMHLLTVRQGETLTENQREQIKLWLDSSPQTVFDEMEAKRKAAQFEDELLGEWVHDGE